MDGGFGAGPDGGAGVAGPRPGVLPDPAGASRIPAGARLFPAGCRPAGARNRVAREGRAGDRGGIDKLRRASGSAAGPGGVSFLLSLLAGGADLPHSQELGFDMPHPRRAAGRGGRRRLLRLPERGELGGGVGDAFEQDGAGVPQREYSQYCEGGAGARRGRVAEGVKAGAVCGGACVTCDPARSGSEDRGLRVPLLAG